MEPTNALLNLINGVSDAVLDKLPTFSPYEGMSSYLSDSIVSSSLAWLNWLIPVTTLLEIVGAWAAALIAYNVVKIAISAYRDVK